MLNRRHFLSASATGLAASLALRNNLFAQLEKVPPLPDHALLDKNEDAFWADMRRQFIIPEDEIYLNNGTVGSSPAARRAGSQDPIAAMAKNTTAMTM